jgi:hypothetical protein
VGAAETCRWVKYVAARCVTLSGDGSAVVALHGMEWPRARTGSSGRIDGPCAHRLRSTEGSATRMPVKDDCRALAPQFTGRSGPISYSVLKALIAGSALNGAWVSEGDQEQGSVGLRWSCGLLVASRNFAGMIGTSGSDARRIVERGDLRLLVEDIERLTEETVESDRVGGRKPPPLTSTEGEDLLVDEGLIERHEG